MRESLYFSFVLLSVLLVGCASKTTIPQPVVDKPIVNETKVSKEKKSVVKITKVQSAPSKEMILSAPSVIKKTNKKKNQKKVSTPKKIKTAQENSRRIQAVSKKKKVITQNLEKFTIEPKEKSIDKKSSQQIKTEKVVKEKTTNKIIKKTASSEVAEKEFKILDKKSKVVKVPSQEKNIPHVKQVKVEKEDTQKISQKQEIVKVIPLNKETVERKKSEKKHIILEKKNLVNKTNESDQKRVEEIMTRVGGVRESEEDKSSFQDDLEESKATRTEELIKKINRLSPVPEKNKQLKTIENKEKDKLTPLSEEHLASSAEKQKSRVEEIMSQISALPIAKEKETVSSKKMEEEKKARIEELINKMNGMNKVLVQEKPVVSEKKPVVKNKSDKKQIDKAVSITPKFLPLSDKNIEKVEVNNTKEVVTQEKVVTILEELPKIPIKELDKKQKNLKQTQEEKDLYNVKKSIGDKVCRDASGLLNFLCMDFIAYVQDIKKEKIKVKIVDSKCENTKYNGIGLYKNTILWDEHYHWKHCD